MMSQPMGMMGQQQGLPPQQQPPPQQQQQQQQQPQQQQQQQQQLQYQPAQMAPQMSAQVAPQYAQGVQQGGQPAQGSPMPGQQPNQLQSQFSGAAAAMQQYQLLQAQHQEQLRQFWQLQMQDVEQAHDFKNHQLPLARIKKIMKADEDVRMISAEAPVVFSKACEMFILELTLRSWIHTEENKRRTLQKNDVAGAITRTDIFDFLVDIVPRDDLKDSGMELSAARAQDVAQVTGMVPGAEMAHPAYGGMYYAPVPPALPQPTPVHQQGMIGAPQMMVGRPALGLDPSMYGQPPRGAVSYMPPMQPGMQPPMHGHMWANQQAPSSSQG